MEFILRYITIETRVKKGYYVLYDEEIVKVVKMIDEDQVELSNGLVIPIKDINKSVVKFLGVYDNQTYSVIHTDYDMIVEFLNSPENPSLEDSYTFMDGLLNGCKIIIKGAFVKIYETIPINEYAVVNSVDIIDKYNLHDTDKRVVKVISHKKGKYKFVIELRDNRRIECYREELKPLSGNNMKSLIRCVCGSCGK